LPSLRLVYTSAHPIFFASYPSNGPDKIIEIEHGYQEYQETTMMKIIHDPGIDQLAFFPWLAQKRKVLQHICKPV